MKASTHPENLMILNIYTPNNRALKYMGKKQTKTNNPTNRVEGEREKLTTVVRDSSAPSQQ